MSREERMNKRTNATNERIARETNETNLAINEANNKANLELANQQNAWNIEQWNRENAYNDPAAQMARYQAAGINANNANVSAGDASHLESAELANQQAGHVDAYQQDFQYDVNAQISRILNGIDAMRSIQDIYQSGTLNKQQIDANAIDLAYRNGNNILSQQERLIGLSKQLQENTDMTSEQINAFLEDIPVSKGFSGDNIHNGARRKRDLDYESLRLANSRSQTAYQKESKEYEIYKEFAREAAKYQNDNSWADYENKRQDWTLKEIDKTYKGAQADAQKEIMRTYKRMKKHINSLHVDRSTKDALQLELMGALFGTDSKYVSDAVGGIAKAGVSMIPIK